MSQPQVILAYSAENAELAKQITHHLQSTDYQFLQVVSHKDTPETPLFERMEALPGKIVLLVTDNLLKSTSAMAGALRFLQNQPNRLLPVVADGVAQDEQTGTSRPAPTHFERVSDIIQYINYWQDRYLDVRRQKRHLEGIDEEGFNAHLRIMRDISSEIGEFLRLLRSAECAAWPELYQDNYRRFFEFMGDTRYASFVCPAIEPQAQDQTPIAAPRMETHTITPHEEPGTAPFSEEQMEELLSEPHINPKDIPGMDLLQEPTPEDIRLVDEDLSRIAHDVEQYFETPSSSFPASSATAEEEVEVPPVAEIPAPDPAAMRAKVEQVLRESMHLATSGQQANALAMLAQAIEEQPDEDALRYRYAWLLTQYSSEMPEAVRQLEILLESHPDHADARFLLGELAEYQGDFAKARACYQKVLQLTPESAAAWYRLGVVLQGHYPQELTEALKAFEKTLALDASHADAQYQLALLHHEAGREDLAEQGLYRVLQLAPQHPFAWYDLALLYHRRQDAEAAWNAYQHAVLNNPELKTPQNDMAFEYHRAQRNAKASEIIEREQSALAEMRENLNRLEDLLRERETELQQLINAKAPAPNQTVLITGATSGIGRATALLLAEQGYRLILAGRRAERLQELQAHLETEYNAAVLTLTLDVRDAQAVQQAIGNLPAEWATIEVLINNAGKAKGLDLVHEGRLEHWDEMIDTNVKGLLYVTRAVAPGMVARRSGHIINVCSTAGKETYPKGNVYCATKFAVDALTKSMRQDLYTHNVRVSQVSPAHVEETEFALVRFDGDAEQAKIYEDFQPLRARDVAEAIHFMMTRPPHVDILDIVLGGTQQASAMLIDRSGRPHDQAH